MRSRGINAGERGEEWKEKKGECKIRRELTEKRERRSIKEGEREERRKGKYEEKGINEGERGGGKEERMDREVGKKSIQ
jgi:hypothetical protein